MWIWTVSHGYRGVCEAGGTGDRERVDHHGECPACVFSYRWFSIDSTAFGKQGDRSVEKREETALDNARVSPHIYIEGFLEEQSIRKRGDGGVERDERKNYWISHVRFLVDIEAFIQQGAPGMNNSLRSRRTGPHARAQ